MSKRLKWISYVVLTIVSAMGIYVAIWYLTLSRHNLDQCDRQIREFRFPDIMHHYRLFYGCDKAAEDGMKRNDIKAFRFVGLYSSLVEGDDFKAKKYLYQSIRLGDNESNYYLFNLLTGTPGADCRELMHLLTSYNPDTPYMREYKKSWLIELKNDGCFKAPGDSPG